MLYHTIILIAQDVSWMISSWYIYHDYILFFLLQKEENAKLTASGKATLPMDEKIIEKELNLKPIHPPARNVALLIAQQVDVQCEQVKQIAGQTFPKLYLTDALQQKTN